MASRLQALVGHFPALILTSARQAGKTTLLRNCFPIHRYVSLDPPSAAGQAERDPQSFFRTNPPPLVVDEGQYAPGRILNVTSLRDFKRFVRVLAARYGRLLNKTEVARDVGVSVKAVGDWVSVLEASGQIVLLELWFSNFGKRIVKTPKVYFRDSGLLCFLLGLDERSLPGSPFLGSVWESFVFAEMRKIVASLGDPTRFWFCRDQGDREIDFLPSDFGENPGDQSGEYPGDDRGPARRVARMLLTFPASIPEKT